jgi:hypothetical protein
MKKLLLSVAILVAAGISAKAQVSLGVKGGINFSKINTDNLKESSVAGYQFGGFARFGSNFYVQPELYLGSSGGKFETQTSGTTVAGEGKVRFTTLNVPVLLGKSFGSEGLNFRLMAGPVYSYILDKNDDLGNNITGAYRDFGDYKNSTLGFQAGGGVDVGNITVDLRYEGGLTKVNENYGQRQNLWALSVGFKIL